MRSGFGVGKPCNQLLIDCEEDRVLRSVLVGMLREAVSNYPQTATASPVMTKKTPNITVVRASIWMRMPGRA